MTLTIMIVENAYRRHHGSMKFIMLLPVIAPLLLGACGNWRGQREVEVVVPPHNNTAPDNFPSETPRKTPDSH
jgi:hypothetical protein